MNCNQHTGQTGQPKTINNMVMWSSFDGTDGTRLPCDNMALVLCEGCKQTSELSCISVSYCYLHSFIFRKSKLLNVILTLCIVWLLADAASTAISCPVCAVLDYRYVDIFFKAVTCPIWMSCFRVTLPLNRSRWNLAGWSDITYIDQPNRPCREPKTQKNPGWVLSKLYSSNVQWQYQTDRVNDYMLHANYKQQYSLQFINFTQFLLSMFLNDVRSNYFSRHVDESNWNMLYKQFHSI